MLRRHKYAFCSLPPALLCPTLSATALLRLRRQAASSTATPADTNAAVLKALDKMSASFATLEAKVTGLSSEMNERFAKVTTEISGLRTEMSAEISGLRTEMNNRFATLEGKLDILAAVASPSTIPLGKRPHVFCARDPVKAFLYGADSTWTLLTMQDADGKWAYYAVGCAHCALFYTMPQTNNTRFVQLPQSVVDCGVISVGLLCNNQRYVYPMPTDLDFVAVKLERAPHGCLDIPNYGFEWPKNGSHNKIADPAPIISLAGFTNAGVVNGDGHPLYHGAAGAQYLVFFEGRGEPGHSGALMLGRRPEGTDALGVYCGIELEQPGSKSMLPRGRIAPLPPFAAIKWFDVISNSTGADELSQHNVNYVAARQTVVEQVSLSIAAHSAAATLTHHPQASWPGVLIESDAANVQDAAVRAYMGSADIGSGRCG